MPAEIRFISQASQSNDADVGRNRRSGNSGNNSNNGNSGRKKQKASTDGVVIRVYDDADALRAALKKIGADSSNVGARVVFHDGLRVVHVAYEPDAPIISLDDIASVVGTLRTKRRDCLDLYMVADQYKMAVLLAVVKARYVFDKYRSNDTYVPLDVVGWSGPKAQLTTFLKCWKDCVDLQNEPGNVGTPIECVARIQRDWFGSSSNVRIEVLRAKELAKSGLGLVTAVGQGSANPPALMVIELSPRRSTGKLPTVVLVGKGVTFDTGGLSIKSYSGMKNMHGDKCGAAVAAAILRYFSIVPIGARIVALLAMAENSVSGTSSRIGDIVTACNGATVEIADTDAEGRLLLSDAIAYSARFKPDYILDFATMTSYASMIHHDLSCVFFTTDDRIADAVVAAGDAVGERCFRMPPWIEYARKTTSQVADYKNFGWSNGDYDDGFMGTMFISNFVPADSKDRWIHFDIGRNTMGSSGAFVATGAALGVGVVKRLVDLHMQ